MNPNLPAEPSKAKSTTKYILVGIKTLITIFLLMWIGLKIEFQVLKPIVYQLNPVYLLLAMCVHGLALFLFSIRWWSLFRLLENCTYRQIFGAYYLGLFWNNFLPSAIGGDMIRILKLRVHGFSTNKLILSTFVDRLIGLFSILLLGITALAFTPVLNLSISYKILLTALLLASLAGMMMFSSRRYINKFLRLGHPFKHWPGARLTRRVLLSFKKYAHNKQSLIHVLFYSFCAQFLIIISYILLSQAINIDIPYYFYFSIIPIVFLAAAIPISIGGLGVREAVVISLLGLYAVDEQTAIALCVLYFVLLLILTLPGAVFIFNLKHKGNDKICQNPPLSNHTNIKKL